MDELGELGEVGLERHKIVFPSKSGDFNPLRETLEKEFTKLKTQDGAFELLRAESGGISRPLKLLSIPSNGYSIPYLKNLVGASTVIYIRPMKSSISREKLLQVVTALLPFTECPKSENVVPIFSLTQHVSVCPATEIEVEERWSQLSVPKGLKQKIKKKCQYLIQSQFQVLRKVISWRMSTSTMNVLLLNNVRHPHQKAHPS